MTRTFVFPYQWFVLYVAQLCGVAMFNTQHVGQHVQTLLGGLTLVDDDGVIHIATLDEVGLEQGLNIADKHKGACWGNLGGEVFYSVDCGKLRIDEFRLKRAHDRQRELIVR